MMCFLTGQKPAVLEQNYLKSFQTFDALKSHRRLSLLAEESVIAFCVLYVYSLWYCCRDALETPLSHPCASSAVKMFQQKCNITSLITHLMLRRSTHGILGLRSLCCNLSAFIHYLLGEVLLFSLIIIV